MSSNESESGVKDVHALTINQHFTRACEYKSEREEFAKSKAKYGSDLDGDSQEDSEEAKSEDEDGEELPPAVGAISE